MARILIWAGLATLTLGPVAIAAASPLIEFRSTVYIVGGMAGVIGLSILLLQPLLAGGYLPGLTPAQTRRLHRIAGAFLALCVAVHIGGLYLTSPPDTLDALFLVSPTPFSVYGVLAMWGIVVTLVLVGLRRRMRGTVWRWLHNGVAVVVAVSTVVHALMIEGAMGTGSKTVLCVAVLAATGAVILHLRVLRPMRQRRRA